jgi:hypothetical protein
MAGRGGSRNRELSLLASRRRCPDAFAAAWALTGRSVLVHDMGETCLSTSTNLSSLGDNPDPGRWSAVS